MPDRGRASDLARDRVISNQTPRRRARQAVRTRFHVDSSCCFECNGDVKVALGHLPGVKDFDVLEAAGVIVVEHDERVGAEAVRRQGASCGVSLAPVKGGRQAQERRWWSQPRLLVLAAAAMLLACGLVLDKMLSLDAWARALYLATLLVGGLYPLRSAIDALRARRLTISTLLIVATAGAAALGVYEEAALLIVVFSVGGILEEFVANRARGSIRALMALAPPLAQRRRRDGSLETVPVEELTPDEVIVVRPGERLPTDGIVIGGSSAVDQSPITGESMPVGVGSGSQIFGGSINGTGALNVRVSEEYADTMLARIIRQVAEAQAHKGRAQRFADRFAAVYTPAIFALALLVGIAPPLLGGNMHEWIYRALVVLVVSCSCGLVMSVPAAVIAAVSRAARDGILIKGGVHLETLGRVSAVAFDKTGTLTKGRPRLTDAISVNGVSEEKLLRLAAAVEAASEHPLGEAIVGAARERGLPVAPGPDVRAFPGVGVGALVEGRRLFVGKLNGTPVNELQSTITGLERQGRTAVVVAEREHPLGVLGVADELREESEAIVAELHLLGIRRILMLSGDNERVAAATASAVGIDDWRASLLPDDKTTAIESLRAEHGAIAMVGDGVNDAPALATADLGIAMGAAGTDVALETADVALMADDLRKLPEAIRLARRSLRTIRQNIGLSLATVVLLLAAALSGRLSLTSGLLLNEGTALLIIANGLRLLRPAE
jgi:Zn2+/Cd2+-exporting ATPase